MPVVGWYGLYPMLTALFSFSGAAMCRSQEVPDGRQSASVKSNRLWAAALMPMVTANFLPDIRWASSSKVTTFRLG